MMLAGIIQLRKPDVVCPVSGEAAVCVRACTCVCVCTRAGAQVHAHARVHSVMSNSLRPCGL